MSSIPRIASFYVILLTALALDALLFSALQIGNEARLWATVFVLSIGIVLFDSNPITLFGQPIEVTISTTIKFAAVLLFPPYVAILSTFAGTTLGEFHSKHTWIGRIFNIAELTVSISASSLIFWILYDTRLGYFGSIQNGLAVIVAGISQFLVSTILVCLIVSLVSKTPIVPVWMQSIRPVIWYELSLYPFGVILAILWQYNPISIVLCGVIFFIIRHSFQVAVQLQRQTHDALRALVRVIDERDHHTLDHSERVSQYAQAIARALDLSQTEIEIIEPAALLHDLGKVGMVDEVLFGDKPLNPEEREHAQKHAEVGAFLLSKFPLFEKGALLVRHHHERYDGKGYPDGLKGEAIPLGARIISVADAYQAMIENRAYRPALSKEAAIIQLVNGSGTQFDPQVVEKFIQILNNNHHV